MRTGIFTLVFVLVLSVMQLAQAKQYGPSLGTAIPGSLTAKDQNNVEHRFETLAGEKGVTLVFVRSADWCPYCQAQMIDLNDRSQDFENAGYPIVTISYDAVEILSAFTKKYNIEYTMISDAGSAIIRDFGILNEEQKPGSFGYGIPHPGIFIVGKDKIIRAKFYEGGYKTRPSLDDVLASIRQLGHF